MPGGSGSAGGAGSPLGTGGVQPLPWVAAPPCVPCGICAALPPAACPPAVAPLPALPAAAPGWPPNMCCAIRPGACCRNCGKPPSAERASMPRPPKPGRGGSRGRPGSSMGMREASGGRSRPDQQWTGRCHEPRRGAGIPHPRVDPRVCRSGTGVWPRCDRSRGVLGQSACPSCRADVVPPCRNANPGADASAAIDAIRLPGGRRSPPPRTGPAGARSRAPVVGQSARCSAARLLARRASRGWRQALSNCAGSQPP